MSTRALRILSIVAALLGVAVALGLAWRGWARLGDVTWWLNYPYPREGSEGLTMYEALLTRLGENIYALPTPTHFISAPYPPIYYYLSGWLLDTANPEFGGGRWLSLLAAIAAAIIGGVLAIRGREQRGRGDTIAAIVGFGLAVLLFGTIYPFAIWAARFRADMLALALMAAGLLAMQWRPRGSGAWLGAGLFALAFFTKQTLLAGPLAGGLYLLLLAGRTRQQGSARLGEPPSAPTPGNDIGRGVTYHWAFAWVGVTAVLFIIPTVLLTWLTGGGYWAKLVTYHALPFSSKTLGSLLGALWQNHWPLLIVAVAYLALVIADYRRGRAVTIVAPYLVAAALLLPTGGVVGADSNHLLTICFALVVTTAQLASRAISPSPFPSIGGGEQSALGLSSPAKGAGIRLLTAFALIALLGAYVWASGTAAGWYGLDLRRPSVAEQTQLGKIIANVRQNPGPQFLSDEVGLLVLAGKYPDYDDLFDLTALADVGKWDESALLDKVRNKQFAIILLNNPLEELRGDILSSAMRKAVAASYKLLFPDVWYTYVPK